MNEIWKLWDKLDQSPNKEVWKQLVMLVLKLPDGKQKDTQLTAAAQFGISNQWVTFDSVRAEFEKLGKI